MKLGSQCVYMYTYDSVLKNHTIKKLHLAELLANLISVIQTTHNANTN